MKEQELLSTSKVLSEVNAAEEWDGAYLGALAAEEDGWVGKF